MFFSRPINWASLLILGLAFWLYYRYPGAKDMSAESPKTIYEFTVKDIRGNDVPLSNYQGKVLLIVNVASKCGLTHSNYKELNILYEKYKDKGLEILAFPCNQFAWQEPGKNEEIEEAVCTRFKAEFPIFDKIDVNGKNAAPLYKFLKSEKGGLLVNAIKWNFTKFLVNKDGKVVVRYSPRTPPLAIEVGQLLHLLPLILSLIMAKLAGTKLNDGKEVNNEHRAKEAETRNMPKITFLFQCLTPGFGFS